MKTSCYKDVLHSMHDCKYQTSYPPHSLKKILKVCEPILFNAAEKKTTTTNKPLLSQIVSVDLILFKLYDFDPRDDTATKQQHKVTDEWIFYRLSLAMPHNPSSKPLMPSVNTRSQTSSVVLFHNKLPAQTLQITLLLQPAGDYLGLQFLSHSTTG